MKKILKDITVEGFRSVVRPLTFSLDKRGFNLLRGDNGSGKTSIIEAIPWTLYGINLKNTLSEQVISWEEVRTAAFRGTRGIINVESDGKEYKIARHINFKGETEGLKGGDKLMVFEDGKLIGTGKKEMQEFIDNLLGVNSKVFLNSVLFGQRMKRLIESDGKDKRQLFEELFDVEWIDLIKQEASEDKKTLDLKLEDLGRVQYQHDTKLLSINEQIEREEQRIEQSEAHRKDRIQAVVYDITDKEKELQVSYSKLEEELKKEPPKFDPTELKKIVIKKNDKNEKLAKLKGEVDSMSGYIKDIAKEHQNLSEEEESLVNQLNTYKEQVVESDSLIDKEEKTIKECEKWSKPSGDEEELGEELSNIENEIDSKHRKIAVVENDARYNIQYMDECKGNIGKLEDKLKTKPEKCPTCKRDFTDDYEDYMLETKENIQELKTKLDNASKHQKTLNDEAVGLRNSVTDLKRREDELIKFFNALDKYRDAQRTIKMSLSKIENLKSTDDKIKDIEIRLKEVSGKLDALQEKHHDYVSRTKSKKESADKLNEEVQFLDKAIEDLQERKEKWNEYNTIIESYEDDVKEVKHEIERLNQNLEDIKKEKPIKSDIPNLKERRIQHEKDLLTAEEDITTTKKHLSVVNWWIKQCGSGGIKSYVFSAMLQKLNDYLVSHGNRLGVSAKFSVDLSKPSKPFISICSIGDKKDKAYEEFSGGQKQRLDIVLMMAMYDLISEGLDINTLFLDEVFEGLDEEGESAAFDLIRTKQNKAIYIISHSPVLDSLYSRVINFELVDGKTIIKE